MFISRCSMSRASALIARYRRLDLLMRRCMSTDPPEEPPVSLWNKTGLFGWHLVNGGVMIPFGGYSMPLYYKNVGIVSDHHHVRKSVGLFDVGHMVQHNFRGPTATAFLEWLTPSSLKSLASYSSTLSVLLNEDGGIIDDLVVTKHSNDAYYVVTNAARRQCDLDWFKEKLTEWNAGEKARAEGPVEHELLKNWDLIALQGPEAAGYLQGFTPFDLRSLTFGKSAFIPIEGVNLHVARSGYTGEDGFEISIPPSQTTAIVKLLYKPPLRLIGLGARDTLRTEAGMCLYGTDLDEETTPVESGLSWLIGKDRRENGDFIGARRVLQHLKEGPPKHRIGLIVQGPPARKGMAILGPSGERIGFITSGLPSPTLGKSIAMGYVDDGWHKKGTKLSVEVRGKPRKATLTSMPFVPTHYYRG